MVSVEYSEAAVEVLGILEYLEDIDKNKIPNEIIEFLENNKSNTYNPEINYGDEIENLNLKQKTRQILAGIYIDYLSSEEEKKEYINKLKQNEIKNQEILKEKYNIDDIFKKNEISKEQVVELTIVKEEKWFIKIINRIKEIFKLNK